MRLAKRGADNLNVKSNLASACNVAFSFSGSNNSVTANVASSNNGGFDFEPPGSNNTMTANFVQGNNYWGTYIGPAAGVTIGETNLFGNGVLDGGFGLNCGLINNSGEDITAQQVFWGNGASPGPGADPADDVCNTGGSTTDTSMPSAAPFK